jgi:RNA polymerase sigma-70 factor (ECF subfamily)
LAALRNFLNNERDKARRVKRGGGVEVVSLDATPAEERYKFEPPSDESPERIFERRWASAVVEQVMQRLHAGFTAPDQAQRFEVLKGFLLDDPRETSYDEAARQLGLSVGAVTSAIHRMRVRFRELFRAEIANTVASAEEVDEEIRHLLTALSG